MRIHNIFSFLWIVMLFIQGNSVNYYVANSGNDSNNGTSVNSPFQTIQRAANVVNAGDTVFVLNGNYAGFSVSGRSGSPDRPIVFQATGNQVVVNSGTARDRIEIYLANYVVIEGFQVTGASRAGISVLGYADNEIVGVTIRNCKMVDNYRWGIFTAYARDVVLEYNECSGAQYEHGIYVSNSADNPVIRYNICYNNAGSGIQINADPAYEGDGIISNALVEGNICYGNGSRGGAAFNFASVRNSIIRNNIGYNNVAGGIAMWDDGFGNQMGCKDNEIYHNTIIMPSNGRWALSMINFSTGNRVKNNILIHLGSRGGLEIDQSSLNGLESDFNIMNRISVDGNFITLGQWKNSYQQDQNSFEASVKDLFVNSASDFHLKESSPAMDRGTALPSVKWDFEKDARPQGGGYDIGADEVATSTPAPVKKVEKLRLDR